MRGRLLAADLPGHDQQAGAEVVDADHVEMDGIEMDGIEPGVEPGVGKTVRM